MHLRDAQRCMLHSASCQRRAERRAARCAAQCAMSQVARLERRHWLRSKLLGARYYVSHRAEGLAQGDKGASGGERLGGVEWGSMGRRQSGGLEEGEWQRNLRTGADNLRQKRKLHGTKRDLT